MIDIISANGLTGLTRANFHNLGREVWSAKRPGFVFGIWDSDVIDGTEYLLIWKAIEWTASLQSENDRIYVYTRTGDSEDLSSTLWEGPVSQSISESARYIQIRIVILGTVASIYQTYPGDNKIGPTIERMTLKGTTSATASLFYSKTFDLEFCPKSIILTAESDIPDGSILRFGVTSLDSVNPDDYQFIESNRTEYLDQLSVTGSKLKFLIEMSGNSNDEVVVHEFAAMFGGDENVKMNYSEDNIVPNDFFLFDESGGIIFDEAGEPLITEEYYSS